MLNFGILTYRNFLSAGTQTIEIDFTAAESTLVVGANGAGKSSMLDALSFVLFGKPHRRIKKPQLVNSINQKDCLVTLTFTVGPVSYRIVRGIKPNIFEIWQNGVMINQESHTRDYQRFLETNILKLNHKSFHQVVVLGSSNFIPFMQLVTWQRREVIEDLLDISIFTKMNTVLKERYSRIKDSIRDTESNISLTNESIRLQSKHLASLREIDQSAEAKSRAEVESLQREIERLQAETLLLQEKHREESVSAKESLDRAQSAHTSLCGYERQIHANITKTVKEARFYETTHECPTCNQEISAETREAKIHDCKVSAVSLRDGYTKIKESMGVSASTLRQAQAELGRVNETLTSIRSNQIAISSAEKRISTILKQISQKVLGETDSSLAEGELDHLREKRETLQDLKSQQVEDRTYQEAVAELLKDTGIKTKIIAQYLPVMNRLINQYLQILDFFVSFNLDENFDETIRSRHRDDFSYSSFSEGEKSRIDLALLFSWRAIARMKNSANTNLLILDETFDSSVDSEGIDNLLKILNSLRGDTHVFVISHKQDLLDGKFDRKLTFGKVNNFSGIRSD